MDLTPDETRLMRRGGAALWVVVCGGLLGLGVLVGFAGLMVATDEAMAARPLFAAAGAFLVAGWLVPVGYLAATIVGALRRRAGGES